MHDFKQWPPQALTALRCELAERLPPDLWDKIRSAVIDYEVLMMAAWQFEHGLTPALLVAAGCGGNVDVDDRHDDPDDLPPPWPSPPTAGSPNRFQEAPTRLSTDHLGRSHHDRGNVAVRRTLFSVPKGGGA